MRDINWIIPIACIIAMGLIVYINQVYGL